MRLVFYHGPGDLMTYLIRLWTWSRYSHVELLFSDGMGFSACGKEKVGGRFKPIHALTHYDVVQVEADEQDVRDWCEERVGHQFDFMGMLAVAFRIPIESKPGRWYCTRICIEALQSAGSLLGLSSHITPQDLYEHLTGEA